MRVIELDPVETIHSLRDRLLRGGRERIVLVVPPRGDVLRRGVDLVLLRRLADRERLEVGLVTEDGALARRARALGLPTFASLVMAEHYRPGWWRGRRAERVGSGSYGLESREAGERGSREESERWTIGHHPLLFALLTTLLALAATAAAALFFLPHATIRLRPATEPAQVIIELTADPALTEPDVTGLAVPAQAVSFPTTWEATGAATSDEAADRRRLGAMARQGLSAAAPDLLAARLHPGRRLAPGSVNLDAGEERFTVTDGVARLALQAEIEGLSVAEADIRTLVYPRLVDALPDSYSPQPATLSVQLEPAAGGEPGRFQATARTTGRVEIDSVALAEALQGRRVGEAARHLSAILPLAEPPTIDMGPGWWWSWVGRLPLRAERIQVQVLP